MKFFPAIIVCLLTATAEAAPTNETALIPLPQKIRRLDGTFTLTPQTGIFTDWASRHTARLLAARLRRSTGYPFKIRRKFPSGGRAPIGIFLTAKSATGDRGPESYTLLIATDSVVIRAPTETGVFYGTQTLLQLLPPEIFSSNLVANLEWRTPCLQIYDWPRFAWRGLMLDVSRHFYNKNEVEAILDEMALYKLNRFHWHLTDDQGWRIQINKYPRLTQIGAWRKVCEIEPPNKGTNAQPAWAQPSADKFGADGRYGGFYTPGEIRQVVAYAAARNITVVPEIEMPGHSTAALAAYPQFSCFGGPYCTDGGAGIHRGIYDPSNEGTFQFLDNVLASVFRLFPGQYVHIGGDEVRKDYWEKSEACRALMKREGLKNGDELQSYFIKRIEKFVNSRGKTLIGWSEILQGGLATNAVVMDWVGGGAQAARAGHDAVMTPTAYCYLDHYQSTNYAIEPRAIGGYLPLKQVYAFEPIPANLPAQYQPHILGAQGNLWTEYVASLAHVQYMIFPRACALAEITWSAPDSRNWDDFARRLAWNEQGLNALGVNYRQGDSEPLPSPSGE